MGDVDVVSLTCDNFKEAVSAFLIACGNVSDRCRESFKVYLLSVTYDSLSLSSVEHQHVLYHNNQVLKYPGLLVRSQPLRQYIREKYDELTFFRDKF